MKKIIVLVGLIIGLSAWAKPVKVDKSKVEKDTLKKGAGVVVREYLYGKDKTTKVCIDETYYALETLGRDMGNVQKELAYWQSLTPAYIAAKVAAVQVKLDELAALKTVAQGD